MRDGDHEAQGGVGAGKAANLVVGETGGHSASEDICFTDMLLTLWIYDPDGAVLLNCSREDFQAPQIFHIFRAEQN